jgi:DNA-binding MarR family transcriptional regulator
MTTDAGTPPRPTKDEVDALLAACQVLVGISAQSMAAVSDVADLIQVRALVVVAGRGSVSLSELAAAMDIHLTRASRLCDRLVLKGLLHRADDPANRRQLILTLTPSGRQVTRTVIQRRRAALGPILARMVHKLNPQQRSECTALLRDFATAAGQPSDTDLWAMGWAT